MRFELVSFLHVRHQRDAPLRGCEFTNTDLHLIHIVRGRAMLRVGAETLRIGEAQVLCIAPRVRFRIFDKPDHTPLEMFNFHCHVSVDQTPLTYLVELPLVFRPEGFGSIQRRLRGWYANWATGRTTDRLTVAAHLHGLLAGYLEQFGRVSALPTDMEMLRLRQQLEQDADQPFDAERYAAICAMSVSQMNRRFRQAYGVTPRAHWQQARYAHLCERLISTDQTIDHIAASMGFTDRFHLTRWFKQVSGGPPAAYRRRMRQLEW